MYRSEVEMGPEYDGQYTACIDEVCSAVKIYHNTTFNSLNNGDPLTVVTEITYPNSSNVNLPQSFIVSCTNIQIPPTVSMTTVSLEGDEDIIYGLTLLPPYIIKRANENTFSYVMFGSWDATSNLQDLVYQCTSTYKDQEAVSNATIIAPGFIPFDVQYEDIGNSSVLVTWNTSGNGQALDYLIFLNDELIKVIKGFQTNNVTLTDIRAETIYTLYIRARYHLMSPPSDLLSIVIHAGILAVNWTRLSSLTDTFVQLQLNCYTYNTIRGDVMWFRPINEPTDIVYSQMEQLANEANGTYQSILLGSGSFTQTLQYQCLISINSVLYVKQQTLTAPSGPPTGLSVDILSSSTLMVGWISPSGGADGYVVQYSPGGGSQLVEGGGIGNTVLNELSLGLEYQIRMFAYRDLPSELSEIITVLFDVPGPVTSLSVQTHSSSILVYWQHPGPSYFIVEYYRVTYNGLCDDISSVLVENNQEEVLLIELVPGLEYSISVEGVNNIGSGEPVTITGRPYEEAPIGYPESVVVSGINSSSVFVKWGDVDCTESNGEITGYAVQFFSMEDTPFSEGSVVVGGEERSVILTGLDYLTLYNITVAAVNSIGTGPYSEGFEIFTGPSAPSGLGCFSSVTGLALHWPEPKDPEILSVYDTAVIPLGLNYSALPGNVGHLFANASVTNTSNTYDIKTSLQSGMYYLTGLRLYSFDYTSGDWATAVCQTEYNIEVICSNPVQPSQSIFPSPSPSLIGGDSSSDISSTIFNTTRLVLYVLIGISFIIAIFLLVLITITYIRSRTTQPNQGTVQPNQGANNGNEQNRDDIGGAIPNPGYNDLYEDVQQM